MFTSVRKKNQPEYCFVRIGTSQAVGRFRTGTVAALERGSQVVCRSARGLESGRLLGEATLHAGKDSQDLADGTILRKMTDEDLLLWKQLVALSEKAAMDCTNWLVKNRVEATLLEVEPLMDGKTLYFHFLADVTEQVQERIDELAEVYQNSVAASRFARLLEHGCGPGCGTEQAQNGCGANSGCAICQVAGSCVKNR